MPQYWSRSNKPAPYKWMAPESLQSNVYSQMSDVWGFGVNPSLPHFNHDGDIQVTLWELFTLGEEPYGDSTTPGHIIQVKIIMITLIMKLLAMPMPMLMTMMMTMKIVQMLGQGRRLGEASLAPKRASS